MTDDIVVFKFILSTYRVIIFKFASIVTFVTLIFGKQKEKIANILSI